MKRLWALTAKLLMGSMVWAGGCRRGDQPQDAPAVASGTAQLPALVLREDTASLLLTWVDEKGDFHVVQKVGDVPEAGRAAVRVVITDREAGTGTVVYVADLSRKNPDGSYPVRTLARNDWEEIGAGKRKARLEALAPSAVAARAPSPSASANVGNATAIVYGADWCKACRDAERYLKQRGANVIHKNIEQSAAAQAEMKEKLKRAGLPVTAQIPVLDVAGEMQLGFSPPAIDRALGRAQSTHGM